MSDSQSSSPGSPEQSSGFQLFEMAYGKHDAFFLLGRVFANMLAEINQGAKLNESFSLRLIRIFHWKLILYHFRVKYARIRIFLI